MHRTEAEAQEETLKMLEVYRDFVENDLAVPVVKGQNLKEKSLPAHCVHIFHRSFNERR